MRNQTFRIPVRTLVAALLAFAATLATAPLAMASEGGGLPGAHINVHDQASLQRGARIYMNNCVGCHSLKYVRYSQLAAGLGLSEQQVMDNLNFTGAKFGDSIVSAMAAADGDSWFGKAPPDLSLEVGAKGADWVAAYMKSFYLDPHTPSGWNNTVFPNVAMPFPLWQLQGEQVAVLAAPVDGQPPAVASLKLATPGSMTPAQYDGAVRDLTAFLAWASAPDELQRSRIGAWVVLYLALFTLFAMVLKKEYWKDVH